MGTGILSIACPHAVLCCFPSFIACPLIPVLLVCQSTLYGRHRRKAECAEFS